MITLIFGPMASGKTTELLRRLERAHRANKNVILLRPPTDNRPFLSRNNLSTDWLEEQHVELGSFNPAIYNTVGIDEGQFHPGLADFCVKWSKMGTYHIIVSALHASSECEMFEEITKLIPYCEEIVKLNAVCTICGNDFASYSYYKLGNKDTKIKVGGDEVYTTLCAKCYNFKKQLE